MPKFPDFLSGIPQMPPPASDLMLSDIAAELREAKEAQSAKGFARRLHRRLEDFAAKLDPKHEAGLAIVNFGQAMELHVRQLGFIEPGLIVFVGVTSQGEEVQLVQHLHQISFLLMKVAATGVPTRQIGFFPDASGSEASSS
jgi:hypothetical protein